jgi:hypothetical protein
MIYNHAECSNVCKLCAPVVKILFITTKNKFE